MSSLIEISKKYYNDSLELVKDNKISVAVKKLEKALKYYCRNVDILNLMGLCKYKLCDFAEASFYWHKSLEYRSDNNRASYYLSILEGKEFEEILEIYNKGIAKYNEGNYKEAIKIIKVINKKDEEWIEPYIIIGLSYYNLKKYSDAKRYLEKGIKKDIGNNKYLSYILKCDDNKKCEPILKKKGKIIYATMGLAVMVVALVAGGVYKKYNNTINELNSYKDRTVLLEKQLEDSKAEYDKLIIDINSINDKKENDKATEISINNEAEIFNESIDKFKDKKYDEVIKKLTYLCEKGKDELYVAEGTYYLALSLEKSGDYQGAYKWYKNYIDKFPGKNYYDDSLYNCGLMLYNEGKINESKEVLTKLVGEVPNSIFVNDKVSEILNK